MTEIKTPFKWYRRTNDKNEMYKVLQWFPDLHVSELFNYLHPGNDSVVKTTKGLVQLKPGDWVVWSTSDGYTDVFSNDEFKVLFEPA